MKFGKQIQSQQIPGWSQYYLDYKFLKKIVSSLAATRPTLDEDTLPSAISPIDVLQAPPRPLSSRPQPPLWESSVTTEQPTLPLLSSTTSDEDRGPAFQAHKVAFFFKLARELEKINAFYLQKEAEVKLRLETLLSKRKAAALRIGPNDTEGRDNARDHVEWRAVEEGFRLLQRDLGKIEQFVEINATGFRKILKKWDKRSKSTTKELYLARQVEVQPVFNRQLIAELSDTVAACLLDLTNVSSTIDRDGLVANDAMFRRHMVVERTNDRNAFHDLEISLQTAVAASDGPSIQNCIAHAAALASQQNNRTQVIRILWKAAIEAKPDLADLIMLSPPFDFRFVDDINGRTCLHEAAKAGELRLVNLCLERGVPIDRNDVYGRSALHYAAMHGHDSVCRRLLDVGVPRSTVDVDNYSPLIYATIGGHAECVRALLDKDVDVTSSPNLRPLSLACQYGHVDVALLLLKHGCVCETNTNGEYPIHLAAREGHVNVCALLAREPGFDVPDKYNEWTPLFHAARYGHVECVRLLLEGGANPNTLDESGRSPAFYAVWYGHLNALALILNATTRSPSSLAGTSQSRSITSLSPLSDLELGSEGDVDMIPSLSLPPPIMPFRVYGHNYLDKTYLIQVSLGHPSVRKQDGTDSPFRLIPQIAGFSGQDFPDAEPSVKLVITANPDIVAAPYTITLPLKDDLDDFVFQVQSLDDLTLRLSIYPSLGAKPIGRAILLPSAFKGIKTRGRYVAPVIDHQLHVIGEAAFEVCIISAFPGVSLGYSGAIDTYWRSTAAPFGGSTKPVPNQHSRPGLGSTQASPSLRTMVPSQHGNPITTSSLTGDHVNVIVQVTRDCVPVVYGQWHIPVSEIDVGVADVSLAQFKSISRAKGRDQLPAQLRATPATELSRLISQSMISLESLLEALPIEVGLNIELAFPSSAMKEKLSLGNSHKLNVFVDSVLETLYRASGIQSDSLGSNISTPRRKIIFSSFMPDVVAAVNWKQPNYPVVFMSFCGIEPQRDTYPGLWVPETDLKCRSISAAIAFLKANNILGLCITAELAVQVPALVQAVKDTGVMLSAFGAREHLSILENVARSPSGGVDAVLRDGVLSYFDFGARLTI